MEISILSEYPISVKLLVHFHLWEQTDHRQDPASNTLSELFVPSSDHLCVCVCVCTHTHIISYTFYFRFIKCNILQFLVLVRVTAKKPKHKVTVILRGIILQKLSSEILV